MRPHGIVGLLNNLKRSVEHHKRVNVRQTIAKLIY